MTRVAQDNQLLAAVQSLYQPVAEEMVQVEAILRAEMRSNDPFVDELVQYGCLLGGKRLRPALMLLIAKTVGQVTDEHTTLAAVVEMIHTATLVHDDVLDEADQRRHLATVNARWDNEASVLLGDFLFTHSFYLASTLETTLACRVIGRATNIVCEGELRQKGSRANYDLDEPEYLEIIEAKTAELCDCACRLGAFYAGADEALVEKMAYFGKALGIAFQIADDLLDVLGEEEDTGKSLGTDLEKQKPTLPIIQTLSQATPADRETILVILQSSDPDRQAKLLPYLEQYDAIQYTRDKAQYYANQAKLQLADIEASDAKQTLEIICDFVVQRSC
ncbi:MAG: octaprenyl-diphosphate synthase [Pirellulaceae bacterium]